MYTQILIYVKAAEYKYTLIEQKALCKQKLSAIEHLDRLCYMIRQLFNTNQ